MGKRSTIDDFIVTPLSAYAEPDVTDNPGEESEMYRVLSGIDALECNVDEELVDSLMRLASL